MSLFGKFTTLFELWDSNEDNLPPQILIVVVQSINQSLNTPSFQLY